MIKTEQIIKWLLWTSLTASVVLPLIILLTIPDKAQAGQIGDTLGGTTAPFINVSAILVVLLTYLYQKKADRRRDEKALIDSLYADLKESLATIHYSKSVTTKGEKTEIRHSGSAAITETIRDLNNGLYKLEIIPELLHYDQLINVYSFLDTFLDTVHENISLSDSEKKLIILQLSLFYRNNLLIPKDQRGDEECKHHKIRHQIPDLWYDKISSIEKKII